MNAALAQTELEVPVSQALALFAKVIRKVSKTLTDIQKAAISADFPAAAEASVSRVDNDKQRDWKPMDVTVDAELAEAGSKETRALQEKQREMIQSLDLSK